MKKYLLLLCLLGCDRASLGLPDYQNIETQSITYTKDDRTGLCFAVNQVGEYPLGTAYIFSNVPCSPTVEKLIEEQNKPKATK